MCTRVLVIFMAQVAPVRNGDSLTATSGDLTAARLCRIGSIGPGVVWLSGNSDDSPMERSTVHGGCENWSGSVGFHGVASQDIIYQWLGVALPVIQHRLGPRYLSAETALKAGIVV